MVFDRTYRYKVFFVQAFGLRLIFVTLPDGDIAVRIALAGLSSLYAWADAVRVNLLRQWCKGATYQQLDRAYEEAMDAVMLHGKHSAIGMYFTPIADATNAELTDRHLIGEEAMYSPCL